MHPLRDAKNGLSCASISSACANEYQVIQVSPHTPASLPNASEAHRLGQRLTLSGHPLLGFPPIHIQQGHSSRLDARVRVAQLQYGSITRINGLGRREGFHLPAPFAAWQAPLRAPRFGGYFQTIGSRLEMNCANVSGVGGPVTFSRVCGPPPLSQIA